MSSLDTLKVAVSEALGERVVSLTERLGELTLVVRAADHVEVARTLRDHPALRFDTAVDLCGMDYLEYDAWVIPDPDDAVDLWGTDGYRYDPCEGARFAVVVHLLSVERNQRLRLRTFCPDNDFPVVESLTGVWPSLGWFEREAFDLFGIVFEGHADLRRILTDYGFVGHPFRKDFPVSGYVEMRYDPEQKRVIYQPVTIEPRENVPRVIREKGYGVGR